MDFCNGGRIQVSLFIEEKVKIEFFLLHFNFSAGDVHVIVVLRLEVDLYASHYYLLIWLEIEGQSLDSFACLVGPRNLLEVLNIEIEAASALSLNERGQVQLFVKFQVV